MHDDTNTTDTPLFGDIGDADISDMQPVIDDGMGFVPEETLQQREAESAIKNPLRFDHIITHLLRMPDFMARAGIELNRQNYFQTEPLSDIIFRKALAYYEHYGVVPSRQALVVELRADYEEHGLTTSDLETIDSKLEGYYDTTELSPDHVRDLLRDILDQSKLDTLKDTLNDIDDLESGRGNIENAMSNLMADVMEVPVQSSPFADIAGNLKVGARVETGIRWLDDSLQGGLAAGEMLTFLAPSGGGKSTLGLQIWMSLAKRKEYCAYLSIEQPMEGDFTLRSCVLAGDCTRDDLAKDWETEVDPKLRNTIDKMSPILIEYGAFFDFVDNEIRSIETLLEPIKKMEAEGKLPKYIILDWWGLVIDQLLGSSGGGDSSAMRRRGRQFLKRLSTAIKALGSRLIVLHQLAGGAAEKGAKAVQSSNSAQEDKNFNNLFDFAITCSNKDDKSHVRIKFDKARRTENDLILLKLDGASCTFMNITNPDEGAGSQEMYGMSSFQGSGFTPSNQFKNVYT